MEPVSIGIICAVVFGTVVALAAFIRHLLLSRDKHLNDEAQERALAQEASTLERMRAEMENRKRFESHYQALGANKEAIQYLDQKIEETIKKKAALIDRYAQVVQKESGTIISLGSSSDRKLIIDKIKDEIDSELRFYDKDLDNLQKRRSALWDTHADLEHYLVEQEKSRNDHLDNIYQAHTAVLEKVYLRHNQNSEHFGMETVRSGTEAFKAIILAPVQFLLSYFSLSTGISTDKVKEELKMRDKVANIESDINNYDRTEAPIPGPSAGESTENVQETSTESLV